MHKKKLIETVANKTGKSQKDVKETLEAILSTINETMKKGEKVTLTGFGTFSVQESKARTGRNVGSTITWARFPDMPAVKHLEGAGAELSVSAGEWAYGSGSIMYADGYVGYSVSIGVGGGVLPVSVSLKGGNTKIKPLTDRSELKYAKEQLSDMRKGLVQDLKNAKSSYNAWNDMVKEEYSK